MKKSFTLIFSLTAILFSLTGCFKPDGVSGDEEKKTKLLYGYWETVYYEETDEDCDVYADGTRGEIQRSSNSGPISCNDADDISEYVVLSFTPTYVTYIATDCPDFREHLDKPYTYTRSGDKLSGYIFQGDFCNYVTITQLDEETLKLTILDEGIEYYEDTPETDNPVIGEYIKWEQTITYRRIQ